MAFGNSTEKSNTSLYEGISRRNQGLLLNFFESLIALFLGCTHYTSWRGVLSESLVRPLSWSFNKPIDPVYWLELNNFILSHVWEYVTFLVKFKNLLKNWYQNCTMEVIIFFFLRFEQCIFYVYKSKKEDLFVDLLNIWSHHLVRLVLNPTICLAKTVLQAQLVFLQWDHNTLSCCSLYCLVYWHIFLTVSDNCILFILRWWKVSSSRCCLKNHEMLYLLSPFLSSQLAPGNQENSRKEDSLSNWFLKNQFLLYNVMHEWRSI